LILVFDDLDNVFTAAVSDLKESWWLFLMAVFLTLLLCLFTVCCLQCCAKIIVWLIIIVALVLIFVVGGIALYYGIRYCRDDLQSNKTSGYVLIGFGSVMLFIGLIIFLIIIALRNRISLAAALVQESSRFYLFYRYDDFNIFAFRIIKNNLCLLLVPFAYAILFAIGVALLIITMVYYFSSLEQVADGPIRKIIFNKNDRYVVLYSVLCFFWLAFFIVGVHAIE
jgi:hypothetical protein